MQEMPGEAPQLHQLAPDPQPQRISQDGQAQRGPEREGEEHRRGRRGRGRDRHRGERGDRPREHQQVGDPAVIEQQRRIHELESRNEQEQPRIDEPRQQEVVRTEPPAFLVKAEAPPEEAPLREERPARQERPEREEPRVDPKKLLDDAGLVMVETDRAKAPAVAQLAEAEQPRLGRPRRERPKVSAGEDELQQVETKR